MARSFVGLLCVSAFALTAAPATAEIDREALVVMLETRIDGAPYPSSFGAGVIVHQDVDRAIIVTAKHNLPATSDTTLYATFSSNEWDRQRARTVYVHPEHDIAVIETASTDELAVLFKKNNRVLKPGWIDFNLDDGVFAVGQPDGNPWRGNRRADRILSYGTAGSSNQIAYLSTVTVGGMSGGALFNEHDVLLGMITDAGTGGGGHAITVGLIRQVLEKADSPFSLKPNDGVSKTIAKKFLIDSNRLSNESLSRAFSAPQLDFNLLHLYWIAGYDVLRIEEFFSSATDTRGTSEFQRILKFTKSDFPCNREELVNIPENVRSIVQNMVSQRSASDGELSCEKHFETWFTSMLLNGVNPNMLASVSIDGPAQSVLGIIGDYPEALLAIALRERHVSASLALLENGAFPNPFQNLEGRWANNPVFVDPIRNFIKTSEDGGQDEILAALSNAGAIRIGEAAGTKREPSDFSVFDLATENRELRCVIGNKKLSVQHCRFLHSLPESIWIETSVGIAPRGVSNFWSIGTLVQPIWANEESVFMVGRITGSSFVHPVIVETPLSGGPWKAYLNRQGYGCRERKDGKTRGYCWRSYNAFPTHFRVGNSEDTYTELGDDELSHLKVEGISMAMPLEQAMKVASSRKFEKITVGDPSNYRNIAMTIRFLRPSTGPRGSDTLTLVAINGKILGIASLTVLQRASDVFGMLENVSASDILKISSNDQSHALVESAAEKTPNGSTKLLHIGRREIPLRSVYLFRRQDEEMPVQKAFIDGLLRMWGVDSDSLQEVH